MGVSVGIAPATTGLRTVSADCLGLTMLHVLGGGAFELVVQHPQALALSDTVASST